VQVPISSGSTEPDYNNQVSSQQSSTSEAKKTSKQQSDKFRTQLSNELIDNAALKIEFQQ